ncbi:hypothetical protein FACS189413_03600 [Bacteroidia bacterium]|nr:hypothetical protein FACS189413_03600 [Bacteroidia bacterium]
MQEKTVISVIVPVYNGEKYLAQALDNLLFQTYKHLEIIVVNDGSTDNSEAIARQYDVCLINQSNQGLSAARNAGIVNATGDYIHFLDVDDWLNLEYYEKMLQAALATNADIACSGIENERMPMQTFLYRHQLLVSNADDKIRLSNVDNMGFCWRYLFRTQLLRDNNLIFEVGRLIEDLVFSLQAVYWANRIVSVPDAVYYYRHRSGSILTSKSKAIHKKRNKDYRHAEKFCVDFAERHHLNIKGGGRQSFQYKSLGIPFLKKRIEQDGKVRWYLFGKLLVFQKKVI